MSSQVQQFISAAVNADPSLAGRNDKDKAAIEKLVGESEGLVKDLSVSYKSGMEAGLRADLFFFSFFSALGAQREAHPFDVSLLELPFYR